MLTLNIKEWNLERRLPTPDNREGCCGFIGQRKKSIFRSASGNRLDNKPGVQY
jgi:hypothetical protein